MIRVLLVDDQALVRAGFRALLDAQDDIEVVAEADDGEQAVLLARTLKPDIALMDIRMPGMDGLQATRAIAADDTLSHVRVVILTTFDLDEYVFEALRIGGSGFLVKSTEPAELVVALFRLADRASSPSRLLDRPDPSRATRLGKPRLGGRSLLNGVSDALRREDEVSDVDHNKRAVVEYYELAFNDHQPQQAVDKYAGSKYIHRHSERRVESPRHKDSVC